jgi:hypothetical protein
MTLQPDPVLVSESKQPVVSLYTKFHPFGR